MYNYNSIFKKFILVFVSVFYIHFGYTQNLISIRGEITDSSERKQLYNASINLIRSKDSILLSTTRANNNGQFILNTLYEGKYILMITYPQYADYIDKIELANGQELNLGKV